MTEKLMPCPFCGTAAELIDRDFRIPFVECPECRIEQSGNTLEEAITAWNTRHPTPAADEVEDRALLLKVASAIYDADYSDPKCQREEPAWDDPSWFHAVGKVYFDFARAAIAAMQARSAEPAGEEGEFETLEEWEYEDQRELSILYNHRYHDGPQFNRAQMRCAIRHGRRLGTTPTNPDRLVEAARIAAQELEASAPWCGEQAAGDILRAAAELRAALAPLKGEGE